jgi:hypothetical protein
VLLLLTQGAGVCVLLLTRAGRQAGGVRSRVAV